MSGPKRERWNPIVRGAVLAALLIVVLLSAGAAPGANESPAESLGVAVDTTAARPAARPIAVPRPADSLSVYALPEILVTASRLAPKLPLGASDLAVAGRADLAELVSSTVAEGLAAEAGVGINKYGSYGSLQTLALRGGSSSEVAYLVDGVPISDSQISVLDLNWLPEGGTDRVEAIKGGASSIYGSGAVSGAVNVVSMEAITEVPSSQVTWWMGDFGSRVADVTVRRSFASRYGVLAAYDYLKSDGWIANSASRDDKYFAKAEALIGGRSKLEAAGFGFNGKVEIPGYFPALQRDQRRFYRISGSISGARGLRGSYYHSTSDQTYTSTYDNFPYRHKGSLDGLQLEAYRQSADRSATSIGAGAEHRRLDSNSVGKHSASDAYGWLQEEIHSGRISVSGSMRVETNSKFGLEVAPQAAAWVTAGGGLAFFAKVDRSFMYPSFNDLYWLGPKEQGDPDLKTEHSTGIEVSAYLDRGPVGAGLAAYYRDVDDMILWQYDTACVSTTSTNAQARLEGIEARLELGPVQGLSASLAYLVASAEDRSGHSLPYKPSGVFTWNARASRAFSKHISGGIAFAGRRVDRVGTGPQYDFASMTCLKDTSLPAYTSGLLYVYLGIDRARVFARITNLFDAAMYSSFGSPRLPGRSYEAGVSWELVD